MPRSKETLTGIRNLLSDLFTCLPVREKLPIHFGVVLGCKGGGVKKKRRRKQGSTGKTSQDKPTQAKGSLRGQMTCSEPGWCLAEAVDVSLGDHVNV